MYSAWGGLYIISVDELSHRRHHEYIRLVVDHLKSRVVWMGEVEIRFELGAIPSNSCWGKRRFSANGPQDSPKGRCRDYLGPGRLHVGQSGSQEGLEPRTPPT
jgi:hypothetical protein